MTTLEAEDVCVCVGVCADDAVPFWVGKVKEVGATVVVVLYAGPDDRSGAEAFAQTIEERLPPVDVPRHVLAMNGDEWGRFYDAQKDRSFGIVHLSVNTDAVPMPSSYEAVKPIRDYAALSDFDDIPETKKSLAQIVEVFSRKSTEGMWPVALLLGETGAGKSFAAQRIAEALRESSKMTGKFVHRNCGEFGREEMNAVLFGTEGGIFSGVPKPRPGAIENARDGILFLDEIGTLPIELQPRLLTVLDKGEYVKHGGQTVEHANCRFIFGTNEDLKKAVAEGRFRFDLYNRIKGIEVRMPSVRARIDGERREEFLDRTIRQFCKKHDGIRPTRHARALLLHFAKKHPWRGNFRDVSRLFQMLHMEVMMSAKPNVLTARTTSEVWQKFTAQSGGGFTVSKEDAPCRFEHPFLRDLEGVYAKDKATLEFAFTCAAESSNCSKAAERFFSGRRQKNPSTSYERFLERFGFAYDADVQGHIKRKKKQMT